jgi:hypothetical protein
MFKKFFKKKDKLIIPRGARIDICPIHNIKFIGEVDGVEETLFLVNVSISGLGFVKEDFSTLPILGTVIKGALIIDGEEVPLTTKVVHIKKHIIGTKVDEADDSFGKIILSYLKNEFTAAQMREVRESSLRQKAEGRTRFWTSTDQLTFYLVYTNEKIALFELRFFGNYISGGDHLPLIVGQLSDQEGPRFNRYGGSEILQGPKNLSIELKETLLIFIQNIPKLEQGTSKKICHLIAQKTT